MRTKLSKIWKRLPRWGKWMAGIAAALLGLLLLGLTLYAALQLYSQQQTNSSQVIGQWFRDRSSRSELITTREQCPGAPFILPSEGFIGLLYADPAGPYNIFNRHTGLDIFGDGEPGQVPVYAAYDGYLTRLPEWVSSVIIEHDDPLQPGRKIWTYYTHLASVEGESYIVDDFPPDTRGVFVEQGTLLGYQGEYNGSATFPIGLHVHFSIVKSDDNGSFLNEAVLDNTLDPSPYFGMSLNIDTLPERPIRCE